MPKTFYTERDIVDMVNRGVMVLDIDDDVVITDLAREKALSLGMRLVRSGKSTRATPQPSAPMPQDEIVAKVKSAVIARLGKDVDAALLEAVIARVAAQIK
ncbi:MAG TPA: hypothetical protein VJL59_00845 [Anaerolineales bacterium]|nr:hypothetical protein [Anaerolineales bacterium]